MSLDNIEAKARVYADARDLLAGKVSALQDGLQQLHRSHLPGIKRALRRASQLEDELRALVEQNPHLFTKPRTVVLHGVKCGLEKGKGGISWGDEDQTVKLIEKKLPELTDVLLKVTKKPIKKALQQLDVKQLKAIGCEVKESGDQVIVRAVDDAVDKLVAALLKGIADEATQADADEEAEAEN